jgi:hypothetical protein
MSTAAENRTVIVTLCVGQNHISWWDKYASKSWRAYATKHGYALQVFREPIDQSEHGAARSASWQKCLILSKPELQHYDQIVWLDSDIVINNSAPEVVAGVPTGKIGCVVSGDYLQREMKAVFIERIREKKILPGTSVDEFWAADQRSFYASAGIKSLSHDIVQGGVLVLSHEHREILEGVYKKFPTELPASEQFPLSAEIINNGLLHRIDSRFNLVFIERMLVHYPYLLNTSIREREYLAHLAVMTEYANAFFLHFAYQQSFAGFLHPTVFSM